MVAEVTEHIGTRVRYWRRRRGGMTQVALAGLSGLSQSYISEVENGYQTIDRRSTLVAIAGALQVSVADLLGQSEDPTDPLRAGAAAHVPAIEVALIEIEYRCGPSVPSRDPDTMAAAVDQITELRRRSADYTTWAAQLPEMLRDAGAYGGVTQARVCYEASAILRTLGYRHLARMAVQLAVAGAEDSGDPAWIGAARWHCTQLMPPEAAGVARTLADESLSALQADAADPRTRQMLGQHHLAAALAYAVDKRGDDAAAHLRAADDEARTLGGDPEDGVGFNLSCFGPTNVGLWRMTVALEQGEYGKVIELAKTVNPGPLRAANRHQSYWLNKGRALAQSGKTDPQARAALLSAEQVAPVPFKLNPLAHDTVLTMVNRARRGVVPRDLRVLALHLGIDVASSR